MHIYHVAPQVHFCGEYDKLLFDASLLFAWEVVFHKVYFLKYRLADRPSGD